MTRFFLSMKLDRESDYIFGVSLSFDIRGNRNIIFKVFKLILLSMEMKLIQR